MKILLFNSLRERIRNTHPRTQKAQLNTILGLLIKGSGMLISLLLVPITIDYLTKDTYGTWLTISSIVTMLTFLDIGIGNGLRNKFSEAIANQNIALAKGYVSTAYILFGIIQLAIIIIFTLIVSYIPWQRVFNTNIDNSQLQFIICITVVAMALKLVLDILSYILFAIQESSWAGLITFLSNALILIGTYILTRFTHGDIVYIATLTAASPILILSVSSLILYRKHLKLYKPSLRFVDFSYAKSLLSLGYKFFIIQISVVILFYTDNLIITQLFGPAEVTTYNVAFRYFNAANMLFGIAIGPYWSAFTEAAINKDTSWMEKAYKYLQKLWLGLSTLVIVMVMSADFFYSSWIGNRLTVPYILNITMGFFVIICCWNNITVAVMNGLGKIRLQLYYSLTSAIINVPLAILFGRFFNLGSAGVILATSVSLFIGSVLGGIQARKLISGNAHGLWAS